MLVILLRPENILKSFGGFVGFLKVMQPILIYMINFQLLELVANWNHLNKIKTHR